MYRATRHSHDINAHDVLLFGDVARGSGRQSDSGPAVFLVLSNLFSSSPAVRNGEDWPQAPDLQPRPAASPTFQEGGTTGCKPLSGLGSRIPSLWVRHRQVGKRQNCPHLARSIDAPPPSYTPVTSTIRPPPKPKVVVLRQTPLNCANDSRHLLASLRWRKRSTGLLAYCF